MSNTTTINIADIDHEGRSRTDYGDLTQFKESLRELGVIQPLVLSRDENGKMILAAGGRRLRSLIELGHTTLHEGVTCDPERPGFVWRDKMREDEILEVELEENLQRKGFTWTEEALMIRKVHAAKVRNNALVGKDWGQRQTGKLLGTSLGYVSNILKVADLIVKGDKDILNAGGITEALKVLMERQENLAQRQLAERAGASYTPDGVTPAPLPQMPNLSVEIPNDSPVHLVNETGAQSHVSLTPSQRMTVKLSNHLFQGDSLLDTPEAKAILPQWPDACMDHIVTDIPYGIDMENLEGIRGLNRVEAQHDVAENVELMPLFLKQAYRLLKDGGFCVFFYDLDHHEKLQGWALKEGFRVQRWPLVWVKSHRCKNDAAAFNFTKATEVAMVLRKGTATLTKPQGLNYIIADGSVERKLYDNPFAKPFAVWKFIYDAIAIQGQKVLDPFAGEMSATRAAVICGLTPYACELESTHFNRGVEHFKESFRLLTAGNVEFQP